MNNCINLVRLSIQNNKKGFIINKNSKNLNILKSFLKMNLINLILIKDKKLLIFIKYKNNKPIFKNILNLYKPGHKLYITYKNLKKISIKHNWILILSTSKGIINSVDAINLKVGGLLVAKIWN